MDKSAIEEDIEDLEKTILTICSDTADTEACNSESKLINSFVEPSEAESYSIMSKSVQCNGSNINNNVDETKCQADIEKEILAFTPIKFNHGLLSPLAKNSMPVGIQHSTPNQHAYTDNATPVSQTKDSSQEKYFPSVEATDSFSTVDAVESEDDNSVIAISSDNSVIEISDDTFEKTFEELLQEVTVLCDEHAAKTGETGDMFNEDTESAAGNHISRIDLKELLCSSPKSKAKDNITLSGRSPLSVSQVADPTFFSDAVVNKDSSEDSSPGRFKGVDKSQHIYDETLVDDPDEASEDILGLDAFSFSDGDDDDDDDDDDKLSDQDATMITLSVLETTLKKAEDSELTTEADSVCETTISTSTTKPTSSDSADSTVPVSHVKPFTSAVPKKQTDIKKSETPSTHDEKSASNLNLQEASKKQQHDEVALLTKAAIQKEDKPIQSSLAVERQNLLEETELMQFVKDKWKTSGIHRPDINLTKCNHLHQTQKHCFSLGLLEGEQKIPPLIRTVNRYMNSESNDDPPSALPEAKRRCIEGVNNNPIGQSTEDLIRSLKGQLDEVTKEWERKQNFLQAQESERESELRCRHSVMVRALHVRQRLELQNLKEQLIYNPFLLQIRILRLHQEHMYQAHCLRVFHRKEMEQLCSEAYYRHNSEHKSHQRLSSQLKDMIKMFENKNVANIISKEGSYVAVDLWKGPCRSNKQTKSLVKVCLPADIASYIMREDEIYDMFYTY